MKTILITGLDGSGKSTVFSYLKKISDPTVGFLHLPYFDLDTLPPNFPQIDLCRTINRLHSQADEVQNPLLKVLSLYASMKLFSLIESEHKANQKQIVFLERHPLIDAEIYSSAYQAYLNPETIKPQHFEYIDNQFIDELTQISAFCNIDYQLESSLSKCILIQIYNEFVIDRKEKNHFEKVFNCSSPDRIYFLDVPIEILISRLSNRQVKEHHENFDQLTSLREKYLELFFKTKNVTIVSSMNLKELNQWTTDLLKKTI